MIQITWQEAERLGGFRVDRRLKFAKYDDDSKCKLSGAVIFNLIKWTGTCSGCFESEDGYPVGDYPVHKKHNCYIGAGCSECGYHGVVKKACWTPYTESLMKLEKELAAEERQYA